jgi:hypothetical protein
LNVAEPEVRSVKKWLRLLILGLACFGAYTLWSRYGRRVGTSGNRADRDNPGPTGRQIRERSELTVTESAAGSDDPVAQATAILIDSDERARLPATADGVEHRRSEDTVEP